MEMLDRERTKIIAERVLANPYIPHAPSERQAEFLSLTIREAFYGGAAGGGKSDALLMGAAMFVDTPRYEALLLRRTYADLSLPGAIMDRSHQWWDETDAKWDRIAKRWEFPSGARVSFGFLANDQDLDRYQGAEVQFVGIDEATQFTGRQYLFLNSRLRRLKGSPVPIRMRGASNPGGVGHEFIKSRYIGPGHDPETPFIPARLTDNPFLDQAEYIRSLEQLDPITRARLLNGDWDARHEGGLFDRQHFRPVDHLPAAAARARYWDMASTLPKPGTDPDWTVGARVSRAPSGRFTIEDIIRVRVAPGDLENLVRSTAELDGTGVAVYVEQEPGASGKIVVDRFIREVLVGYPCYAIRATGSKEDRARPFSAQSSAGNVDILRAAWNLGFYDEAEAFPYGAHDDQVDACSGAFAQLAVRRVLAEAFSGGSKTLPPVTLASIR